MSQPEDHRPLDVSNGSEVRGDQGKAEIVPGSSRVPQFVPLASGGKPKGTKSNVQPNLWEMAARGSEPGRIIEINRSENQEIKDRRHKSTQQSEANH